MADGFALAQEVGSPTPQARGRAVGDSPITIGLVNNMPDAAMAATEAQFRRLIERGAAGRDVRLKLFLLPGVVRSEAAHAAMAGRYAGAETLAKSSVDALIVTGAEPLAADLRDEPFWPALADLVDWAEANTISTLFSCLAAHAAVLHLDGITRTPLAAKCSGVFAMQAGRHPLTIDQPSPLLAPHSRWNTLDEGALTACGYQVLTRSDKVGVDAFIRERNSLLLFLHGHPEYDSETLMLEYRRGVRRFLIGERQTHPAVPVGYFDPDVEVALIALAADAERHRPLTALSDCVKIMRSAAPSHRWNAASEQLYRNWIGLIAARLERRVAA